MSLFLVTAPASEPVSLSELKLHLRVDSTAEDDLISGLNATARGWAEAFTHRAIPLQTWDWKLDSAPCSYELFLPKAPCVSVTSITYIDTNGDTQTVPTSVYDTDLPTGPYARAGRIFLKYGQVWPNVRNIPNCFTVRFVAGYSGTALALASLTQTAGLATGTVTAGHGLTNLQMVTVAGANQSGYNGTFTATYVSATQFTFPVASGTTSPATGTVTVTPDPVPVGIKAAIKILAATWYGPAREGIVVGATASEVPMAVNALLWPFASF